MAPKIEHDPIEDDPKYRTILDAAEREAQKECKSTKGRRGHCHRVWGVKKRILREKYHLNWQDPSELNPNARFD